MPSPVIDWPNRSVSSSSNDETLLGSPAQVSGSSASTSPESGKGVTSKTSSPPSELAATELIGSSHAKDAKTEEAEGETEKYWIEKDQERLEVLTSMEKTMAEMKGEHANTVAAFRMASDANHKLQAELKKKTTSLTQVEEDMTHLVHDLDVAEMGKEKLEKELAYSRRDRKRQYDRAEQALSSIDADPTKEFIAQLLQAMSEAESSYVSQESSMESEMDSLRTQLKERCDSVVRLTRTLSRVADFDRWKDIEDEVKDLKIRAGTLPDDLEAAWFECDKWKELYSTLKTMHQQVQASHEKSLQDVKDFDLSAIREQQRKTKKAVRSIQALKDCLKQVFERMVRCSLCLESDGFLAMDNKHWEICEQVIELTGEDYEQALVSYYCEHEIRDDFKLLDDDEDGEYRDYDGHYSNNEDQARIQESEGQDDIREQDESSISNHWNVDLHTPNDVADTLHDSSSAPLPGMTEVGSVVAPAANEEEIQGLPETQEAPNKREVAHTVTSTEGSLPAADQATPAVSSSFFVAQDQGIVASDGVAQTLDNLSADGTAGESADYHLPRDEIDNVASPSTNEHDIYSEPPQTTTGNGVSPTESEDDEVALEDHCSTGTVVKGPSGDSKEVPNDVVAEGKGSKSSDGNQRSAEGSISARDNTAEIRTYSTPKRARSNRESPVDAPAASSNNTSSGAFTFSKSFDTSKLVEATVSTSARNDGADVEATLESGSGKFPSSSLFATPVADPKEKFSGGSMSSKPLKASKPMGATNPSTTRKGNSQDIWGSTSFANNSFSLKPAPGADLQSESNLKPPFFKPLDASKPAEAKPPTPDHQEAEHGDGVTNAHKEGSPISTKQSFDLQQLRAFNFGGDGDPVSFIGSSQSLPAQATQPASTGTAMQSEEKVAGDIVSTDENAKEDLRTTEAWKGKAPEETSVGEKKPEVAMPEGELSRETKSQEKKLKKKSPKQESAPKETDNESLVSAPSEPSRAEKRAAKKAVKKAAKKAEKSAVNAKAAESRRVQRALLMK